MAIKSKTQKSAQGIGEALPAEGNLPESEVNGAVAEKAITAQPAASLLPAISKDSRGFEEEVDQSDLIIPRAKLVQPTSEELTDPTFQLRGGAIINSLTKESLSNTFVPVFYYKEYLRFNGRNDSQPGWVEGVTPGALIWRTRDAADPRVKECDFGPNGETPLAITTLNFFSLFEDSPMPVILSFGKTSYKAGKNLLSLAKLRGGAMFSRRYKLSVIPMKNDKGNYFVLKVDPFGDCDQQMFANAESYFNQFAVNRASLKTHVEDAEIV